MNNQVLSLSHYKCDTVNRNALSGVVLPPETETYQPIGHDWLLNNLEDGLRNMGLGFGSEHHGLSHDGSRYFGLVEIVGLAANDDYSTLMGVRNSLDKRFGAQVAFGNQVMVCANLQFYGNYMIGRKHTPNIMTDLPNIIEGVFERIPDMNRLQDQRIEAYRETSLSISDADHAIIEMYRNGGINTARIEKVVKEFDNPTFEHGDRSVWRLMNAATQAMKGMNIHELPQRTIRVQEVCDRFAEFEVAA